MVLDTVARIVVGVCVHLTLLKYVPINSVKNVYLDTKINLLRCQGADLHIEVGPDPVVALLLVLVYIGQF